MPDQRRGNQLSAKVRDALIKTLEASFDKKTFSSSKFFKRWFTTDGTAYHFLFKKNLRVTNIQFAELISLIRCHARPKDGTEIGELQFVTTNRFRNWLDSIISTFNAERDKKPLRHLVDLYGSIIARTIIVDPHFTSSFVCVSKYLELDLLPICAYSGYIHSCGRSVFIRKIEKTRMEHLFDALDEFLKRYGKKGKKIFFAVYAHEDFSSFDRSDESNLLDGLDEVKIHVEKFFMGQERLVSVLRAMKERYAERLEIPDPGDFREKHDEFRQHPGVDPSRTLWLIRDFSIEGKSLKRGGDEYFVCYEQLWKNENPFHIFDENKPAWISHTTIPHTLLGAMINISRPYWEEPEEAVLCDPFVGTGTTLLETLKYESVSCNCSDVEPVAPRLLSDNLEIFGASLKDLRSVEAYLKLVVGYVKQLARQDDSTPELFPPDGFAADYEWARKFLKLHNNEAVITTDAVKELGTRSINQKLVFYLSLRTALRNIAGFERESRDWNSAYHKEARVLLEQISGLIKLRERQQKEKRARSHKNNNVCVFQTKYSLGCGISFQRIKQECELKQSTAIRIRDARSINKSSCDVIVTDPPYGFNTEDGSAELSKLWAESLRAMLKSLIGGKGQLVICLPDRSHTGRNLQYFTQKDFITPQILAIADGMNLEVIVHADIVPFPTNLFRPPYYWESERALRRQILHFRFRPRR
jgi:tRNA G10  N-methylase Trm11